MQSIRQKLLATFQVEHRDHIEQMRSLLAMIDKLGGQAAEAQLEEVYRRAHTLKGAAHVVELASVESLAHRLETLFARIRQGSLSLNSEVMAAVHTALDAMEDSVAGLGGDQADLMPGGAQREIERLLGTEPRAAAKEESAPAAEVPAFQPIETIRVNAQNFDGLLRSAVELLAETQTQGRVSTQLNALALQTAGMEKEAEKALRASTRAQRLFESTPEFAEMRSQVDSLARLARSISMQIASVRRLQQRGAWTMTRLGKQLQRDVWQARMVPIEGLLEGYRKMMRDLARDESKQIEFRATSSGENADRRVLEVLKDPLMHALRNAVSHGIEFPHDRMAAGKPPQGLVALRVEADGRRLRITVEDDGRGVDVTKVLGLAVHRKILSDSQAARCSQRDLARILFSPGFSTSSSITNLSGRGMGLSVVYEAVRRLQGEADIEPRLGGGTSLLISVPVSISTHSVLLVSCAGQPFAIPFYSIERLYRMRPDEIVTEEGKPVVQLDGNKIPLFALRYLLDLPIQPDPESASTLAIAILRSGAERAAVTVDSFLGQSEAVIHHLGPAAPREGKTSGGIVLDDGSIALVINPASLLDMSNRLERPALAVRPTLTPPQPSSILVVDDSITTRTLEKSILEAHGYRVRTAVDGLEALAQLRAERADLVISDVQMPNMDGFELLEAIKKDRALTKIPVIVVTSLERREDRERGLSLGADAYIVKRKFDQGELLATIRQIL